MGGVASRLGSAWLPLAARVEVLTAEDPEEVFGRFCPAGRTCERSVAWHRACDQNPCFNHMYQIETDLIATLKEINLPVPQPVYVLDHCAFMTYFRLKSGQVADEDQCVFIEAVPIRVARETVALEYLLPLLRWGAARADGLKVLFLLGDTARVEFTDAGDALDEWIVAGYTGGTHFLASASALSNLESEASALERFE